MENKTMDTVTESIGFDLGHAETSVTQASMGATTQPLVLDVQGRKTTITAVAEANGRVLVGGDAYMGRNPEGLKVAFKSPDLKNPATRRPTKLFAQRIVELLTESKQIEGGARSLFVVGCPSGWDRAAHRDYAALLQEAGMQQVQIVPESRAAFLAARQSGEVPPEDLEGAVLIVDIGSSTTDFTFVVQRELRPVDFGHNELGAGILDKIILERELKKAGNADLNELFEEYPQYKAQCLLFSRKVKESYFNSNNTQEVPADIAKKIGEKRILFEIEIGDDDMAEILSTPIDELGGLAWPSAFQKELQSVREKTADIPPTIILLTGGASRMPFVLECCEEIFPQAKVKRGPEPESTIARGLALAGRLGKKGDKFHQEIEDIFKLKELRGAIRNRPDNETKSPLEELIANIANFLTPELEHIILLTFIDWRNGHISTLNHLESETKNRIKQYLEALKGPGAKKLEEKVILAWLDNSVKPVVEKLVEPICERAGIPSSNLSLPRDFNAALKMREISSGEIRVSESLDKFSFMAATIGSVIIATLLGGGGTALLISGPVGWIIGLAIGATAMFMSRQAAMDKVRDANIPILGRGMMTSTETVREKLAENRAEFSGQISDALRKNTSAFDEMINGIEAAVKEELEKAADKAAMLIK